MKPSQATLKDGRTIDFMPEMIGDGTMKEVYFTTDRKSVVCFYKDSAQGTDPVRLQRLEAVLGKFNPTVSREKGGAAPNETDAAYYRGLYCWPTAIVVKPRFGLIAPTYPANFFFATGPDFLKGKEKNGMRFIGTKNRGLLKKYAPAELGDWRNYFALCVQMARAVSRLHNAGLAHSDLSPNNVLADPSLGLSLIIDIDSLVVEGLFPPDVLGTKGYIAPEVLSTLHLPMKDPKRKFPNTRTDLHALPVLIYQYLLRRHPLDGRRIPPGASAEEQDMLAYGSEARYCENPADDSNRPEGPYVPASALGGPLAELFQRAFVKGLHSPADRPSGLEWVRGLIKTWDMLVPCANPSCDHKWYVLHDPAHPLCPFCQAKPAHPFPVLKLRTERRPGQWMTDGSLAVYHNLSIFRWHAFGLFPGPEVDKTPQAYCAYHQGKWLLINQNLGSLTCSEGDRVGPGQAVELKDGVQLRFSQEPQGRIADVQLVSA